MKVVVTGAEGFLGWHTRVRLRALLQADVVAVGRSRWHELSHLAVDADAIIHIAGVNRGEPAKVEIDNVLLADSLGEALTLAERPQTIVFANSVQAGNDTPYGQGKAHASDILAAVAESTGSPYVDVRLPNLFGEHGAPNYNSFVATFVDAVIAESRPQVVDREVALMHAQAAAAVLTEAAVSPASKLIEPPGNPTTIQNVLDTLIGFALLYRKGDIPPLHHQLDIDLFNTLRAGFFPALYPIPLVARDDDRGRLVECVRAHGGQGQTFVSTTRPGVTRGEHFHLGKVERFVVLSGQARISLRRMFDDSIVSFDVNGEDPCIVDMPTMWAHNITNTGASELVTLFWTHSLFDPASPDTFPEPVVTPSAA